MQWSMSFSWIIDSDYVHLGTMNKCLYSSKEKQIAHMILKAAVPITNESELKL